MRGVQVRTRAVEGALGSGLLAEDRDGDPVASAAIVAEVFDPSFLEPQVDERRRPRRVIAVDEKAQARETPGANRRVGRVGLGVSQLEVEPGRVQEVVESDPQLGNEWRQVRHVHEIGCKRHPVGQGPSHEQTGGAPRDVSALEIGHPLVGSLMRPLQVLIVRLGNEREREEARVCRDQVIPAEPEPVPVVPELPADVVQHGPGLVAPGARHAVLAGERRHRLRPTRREQEADQEECPDDQPTASELRQHIHEVPPLASPPRRSRARKTPPILKTGRHAGIDESCGSLTKIGG